MPARQVPCPELRPDVAVLHPLGVAEAARLGGWGGRLHPLAEGLDGAGVGDCDLLGHPVAGPIGDRRAPGGVVALDDAVAPDAEEAVSG